MKRLLKPGALAQMILPFQNGIKPTWSLKQIRSALTQHQMGMLGQSSLLFDSMLEDDEFPSTLKRRCDGLLAAPFRLEPKKKPAKKPRKPKDVEPEDGAEPAPEAPPPAPPEPQVERTVTRKSDGTRSETVKEKPGAAPPPAAPSGPPKPVEPIEPDSTLTKQQKRAEDLWPIMVPYGEALRLDADLLVMGVAVGTLDWDTRSAAQGGQPDGIWVPVLRALPTEFLRYDHAERRWKYQAQKAAEAWKPESGALPSVISSNASAGELDVNPGDGKWVLITYGHRGWLWGLIRGLSQLWHGKQTTYCNWQRYNQKHGLPIFKAKLPITGDADEKEEFVDDLGSLAAEGIIGTPQDEEGYGYDVDILEPKTVTWQGFQAALERDDRKIQVALLGGNLGAEVTKSGGNMGAAETHASEMQKLCANDAKVLGEGLKEQLLKPFLEYNFGPEKAKELPMPFWDCCPEEDARSWQTALGQFAVTVKTIGEAGYEIMNLGDVADDLGLQLGKKPEAPAPAPGAPGEGPNGAPPGQKPPAKPGAPGAPNASTAK